MKNQNKNGNLVGGFVLIALGIIFSFKSFFDINLFSYIKNVWPLGLVALGIYLILKEKDDYSNGNPTDNTHTEGTHF
jgi:phage shock protein C